MLLCILMTWSWNIQFIGCITHSNVSKLGEFQSNTMMNFNSKRFITCSDGYLGTIYQALNILNIFSKSWIWFYIWEHFGGNFHIGTFSTALVKYLSQIMLNSQYNSPNLHIPEVHSLINLYLRYITRWFTHFKIHHYVIHPTNWDLNCI